MILLQFCFASLNFAQHKKFNWGCRDFVENLICKLASDIQILSHDRLKQVETGRFNCCFNFHTVKKSYSTLSPWPFYPEHSVEILSIEVTFDMVEVCSFYGISFVCLAWLFLCYILHSLGKLVLVCFWLKHTLFKWNGIYTNILKIILSCIFI